MKYFHILLAPLFLLWGCQPSQKTAGPSIKVLLIEGQNNHRNWPETSPLMKSTLEKTGRFEVTITRTPPSDGRKQDFSASQPLIADMPEDLQQQWATWRPDFTPYDVVISNYNGVFWPEEVQLDFVEFVNNGGGFVPIHAANNAFTNWEEYQKIIGVGGWYGRWTEKHGSKIIWQDGKMVLDNSPGKCGAHGKRQPVYIDNRNQDHPIIKGFPSTWKHPTDEIYYNMCGPAKGINVVASAYSDPDTGGSGKNQPIVITLNYGQGRVFHNMLGHTTEAFTGAGFQHLLVRGTEWAATGKVTFPEPDTADFSTSTIVTKEPGA